MTRDIDCIICGSCVVDLLTRPVVLSKPIGRGVLHQCEPIVLAAGGIVSNAGVTMARLGMKVAALSYLGADAWAPVVRNLYRQEGIDDSPLLEHPTHATSTTVVLIEESGERSFYHCVGAPKLLDARAFLERLDLFARSRSMLLGYYSLLPNLEHDLPEVFRRIRETGCQTAMDAAGAGGSMKPLDRTLPYLDVWVPSFAEAKNQTGQEDPNKIIDTYRNCGAPGIVGVKLGKQGVLLSSRAGEYISVAGCTAPAPVVDTTGAGDSFYAGLLTGLLKGLPVEQAGRLGCAAGACCVTSMGGASGGRNYAETSRIAGL